MVNEEPLIIDAHQHFWKYHEQEYAWISDQLAPLKRDFLPEELLQLLNKEKISGAISVQARQSEKENDFYCSMQKLIPSLKEWLAG